MRLGTVGMAAVAALGATSGVAMGSTINGLYQSSVNSGLRQAIAISAGNFSVGALTHNWSGGTGELAAYNGQWASFCIDNQTVSGSTVTFTMVDVTDAPIANSGNFGNPGNNYSAMQRQRLNAIALAARDAGYLNSLGFYNVASGGDASAAIQLLVWESLWESTSGAGWNLGAGTMTASSVPAGVQAVVNALITSATTIFNDANTQILVRSFSTNGGQDQMVLVPLPPAAWAGLSTMAGVLGLAYVRRRRQLA